MRVGWLTYHPAIRGGAELDAAELLRLKPNWAEVVECRPGEEAEVDVWAVHQCGASWNRHIIPPLESAPIVKRVCDLWSEGDNTLRAWLLSHSARLLFLTPLHRKAFRWYVDAPVAYSPPVVNLEPFEQAAAQANGRKGIMWLGRLYPGKGLEQARHYAATQGVEVDVYGYGGLVGDVTPPLRYKGDVHPAEVPALMARYETFLFLPDAVEPGARTVIEAHTAGCKLVVNGNVGALHYLQHEPEMVQEAASRYWQVIEEVGNA